LLSALATEQFNASESSFFAGLIRTAGLPLDDFAKWALSEASTRISLTLHRCG
jgi:hypothetical protein